jgi:hypothetical protein
MKIVLYSFGFCVFAQLWLKASVQPKPGFDIKFPNTQILSYGRSMLAAAFASKNVDFLTSQYF